MGVIDLAAKNMLELVKVFMPPIEVVIPADVFPRIQERSDFHLNTDLLFALAHQCFVKVLTVLLAAAG